MQQPSHWKAGLPPTAQAGLPSTLTQQDGLEIVTWANTDRDFLGDVSSGSPGER